jgi:hypothetical protein
LNFGLTIWEKSELLLGTTWELEVPFGEHIGSMMGTKEENKKFLPPSFAKKEKNWTPHESMQGLSFAAWNFYVQNSLSPFLAWTNRIATPPKNKKERTLPPPPKEKTQTTH